MATSRELEGRIENEIPLAGPDGIGSTIRNLVARGRNEDAEVLLDTIEQLDRNGAALEIEQFHVPSMLESMGVGIEEVGSDPEKLQDAFIYMYIAGLRHARAEGAGVVKEWTQTFNDVIPSGERG